jgi:hypothetical protein
MSITRSHSNADITHLVIPPLYGQRMRYCKPVPVDLKICTLAASTISNSDVMERKRPTYYAGNKRTFSAVETTAHCVRVG